MALVAAVAALVLSPVFLLPLIYWDVRVQRASKLAYAFSGVVLIFYLALCIFGVQNVLVGSLLITRALLIDLFVLALHIGLLWTIASDRDIQTLHRATSVLAFFGAVAILLLYIFFRHSILQELGFFILLVGLVGLRALSDNGRGTRAMFVIGLLLVAALCVLLKIVCDETIWFILLIVLEALFGLVVWAASAIVR